MTDKPMTLEEIAFEVKKRIQGFQCPKQEIENLIQEVLLSIDRIESLLNTDFSYRSSAYVFKLEQFIKSKGLEEEAREYNKKIMEIVDNDH